MGCVFSVNGVDLDVDACLRTFDFVPSPYRITRKGDVNSGFTYKHSGFAIRVSEADFGDFAEQIEDAIKFLELNLHELRKLQLFPDVERCVLDFPIEEHTLVVESDAQVSHLLELVEGLAIHAEVTRYPPATDA